MARILLIKLLLDITVREDTTDPVYDIMVSVATTGGGLIPP